MTFDSLMLHAVCEELRARLTGATVDDVVQPIHDEVYLSFGRGGVRGTMVLSSSAEYGRVHLVTSVPVSPSKPYPFCSALRRHLRGAHLERLEQVGFDRILQLHFTHCEGYGPECRRVLIAEIMGRHANLVLVGPEGEILACAKHVTSRVNRYRETLPGLQYVPPPSGERINPLAQEAPPEPQRGELTAEDWLQRRLMGASPVLRAEVLVRAATRQAQGEPSCPELIGLVRELVTEATSAPHSYLYARPGDETRTPVLAYPLKLQHRPEELLDQRDSLSEALEGLVTLQRQARLLRVRSEHLVARIRAASTRVRHALRKCKASLENTRNWPQWKRYGELLLAYAGQLSPGLSQAVVADYFDPGQPLVTIELNRDLSVPANAQRYFDRYKRARRAQQHLEQRINTLTKRLQRLDQGYRSARTAPSVGEVEAVADWLERTGVLPPEKPRRSQRTPTEPWRVTTTRDGIPIIYGKTEEQNEAVLKAARPRDVWFHVRGAPGGHVIVRWEKDPADLPRGALSHAASLAAALSKVGASGPVEVDYTARKYVTKRRGAGPGQVTYTNAKTVLVAPRGQPP